MLAAIWMLAQEAIPEGAIPPAKPNLFPWYNWLFVVVVIAIVVGYKIYRNKTMT